MKLKKFVKENRIQIVAKPVAATKAMPNPVTLENERGEQITVDFPAAAVESLKFTAYDVLCYLLGTCQRISDWRVDAPKAKRYTRAAFKFKSWCAYFGQNSDSIRAKKSFNECKKMFHTTRTFMGETFDEFLSCRE